MAHGCVNGAPDWSGARSIWRWRVVRSGRASARSARSCCGNARSDAVCPPQQANAPVQKFDVVLLRDFVLGRMERPVLVWKRKFALERQPLLTGEYREVA